MNNDVERIATALRRALLEELPPDRSDAVRLRYRRYCASGRSRSRAHAHDHVASVLLARLLTGGEEA